ncbi:unnamed protein product [Closterium sp. NIES-65]|nr:unnamed protein product [Closterium sp. NIES-65]
MEDPDSQETRDFVTAQNALTNEILSGIKGREKLKERLTDLLDSPEYGCPFKYGSNYFYFHNTGLQAHSVLYVQKSLEDEAEVLLDPNTWSDDGTVSLGTYSFSEDGEYLAYAVSQSGSDWNAIKVLRVGTKDNEPDELKNVNYTSIAWTHDNRGFFYNRYDGVDAEGAAAGTARVVNQRVYYHVLGQAQADDALCWESKAHPTWMFGSEYLIISTWANCDHDNLVHVINLQQLPRGRLDGSPVHAASASDGNNRKDKEDESVEKDASNENEETVVFKRDDRDDEDGGDGGSGGDGGDGDGGSVRLPAIALRRLFDGMFSYVTNDGPAFTFHTNKDAPRGKVVRIILPEGTGSDGGHEEGEDELGGAEGRQKRKEGEKGEEEDGRWEEVIGEAEGDVLEWIRCVNQDMLLLCYMRDVKNVLEAMAVAVGEAEGDVLEWIRCVNQDMLLLCYMRDVKNVLEVCSRARGMQSCSRYAVMLEGMQSCSRYAVMLQVCSRAPGMQSCSRYAVVFQVCSRAPGMQSCSRYAVVFQVCSRAPGMQSCSSRAPGMQSCSRYAVVFQVCSRAPGMQSCSRYAVVLQVCSRAPGMQSCSSSLLSTVPLPMSAVSSSSVPLPMGAVSSSSPRCPSPWAPSPPLRLAGGVLSQFHPFSLSPSQIRSLTDGLLLSTVPLPMGAVSSSSGRRSDSEAFFSFESFLSPRTIFRCDLTTPQPEPEAANGFESFLCPHAVYRCDLTTPHPEPEVRACTGDARFSLVSFRSPATVSRCDLTEPYLAEPDVCACTASPGGTGCVCLHWYVIDGKRAKLSFLLPFPRPPCPASPGGTGCVCLHWYVIDGKRAKLSFLLPFPRPPCPASPGGTGCVCLHWYVIDGKRAKLSFLLPFPRPPCPASPGGTGCVCLHWYVIDGKRAKLSFLLPFPRPPCPGRWHMHVRLVFVYLCCHQVHRQLTVPGFDPSLFEAQQVFVPSTDGTRIPMFVVCRKDLPHTSDHFTLLYGYGGFDICIKPSFSVARVLLMRHHGAVVAVANIRGGGEYGERWRRAGPQAASCAEHLIHEGYTSPSKLVIEGGSNGGLLVSAAVNQVMMQSGNTLTGYTSPLNLVIEGGRNSTQQIPPKLPTPKLYDKDKRGGLVKLVIEGGSNGGLLVSAAVNQVGMLVPNQLETGAADAILPSLFPLPLVLFSLPLVLFPLPLVLSSLPLVLFSLPLVLFSLPLVLFSLPLVLFSLHPSNFSNFPLLLPTPYSLLPSPFSFPPSPFSILPSPFSLLLCSTHQRPDLFAYALAHVGLTDMLRIHHFTIRQAWTSPYGCSSSTLHVFSRLPHSPCSQRPDLFACALAHVGLTDMLRFHQFTIGHAWTSEYGCSSDPHQLKSLLSYSPLHNVRRPWEAASPTNSNNITCTHSDSADVPAKADVAAEADVAAVKRQWGERRRQYPAVMLLTGDHDDRVPPSHSLKFAAQLQHVLVHRWMVGWVGGFWPESGMRIVMQWWVGPSRSLKFAAQLQHVLVQSTNGEGNQISPIVLRVDVKAGHGSGASTQKIIERNADAYSFAAIVTNTLWVD